MFEARLTQASVLKKLIEAVKDLVTQANFECSAKGISLQAMDSSHVSLVTMLLRADGFEHYRCDRNVTLGINLNAMSKILKCAGNEDKLTIKADDKGDTVTFMFEGEKQAKISDFELKLMDIESELLGIPEGDAEAVVKMPSGEFQRTCRDLTLLGDSKDNSTLGDTVKIAVSKDCVKFSVEGDMGSGNIQVMKTSDADTTEDDSVSISLNSPIEETFALRYLNLVTKATPLSKSVTLSLNSSLPLVIEYNLPSLGGLSFYLAPRIGDEDEE
jgi:proliferating cell nuclear antigen